MLTLASLKTQKPDSAKPKFGNPFLNGSRPAKVVAQAAETSSQMIDEIETMRDNTEIAALNIGFLLERIVSLATKGNKEVQETLADAVGMNVDESVDSSSINELVLRQVDVVNTFIASVRSFLAEQVKLSQQASEACETISRSAMDVSELTKTSQVLSINLRIEAARLGDEGSSFTALGQEVHAFSAAVREAADEISSSVGNFRLTIPKIREKAIEMEHGVSELAENFQTEMSSLSERTGKMHDSLKATLDQVELKNNEILDCSYATLSHLAFQDPLSQGMQRAKHNIAQLQCVIDGEKPDFISPSKLNEDVGANGHTNLEAGEVDLF